MADNRSTNKCVIFIALIACSQAILWAEGRQLKFMENEETAKHGSKNINLQQNSGELKEDSLSTKPSVDVPAAENTVSVNGKKNIYPPMRFSESAASDTDDFRPTAPGNSPGVGHKPAKEEEDFRLTDTDDFRPTTPGNSPGAGHKHAKEEEDFRLTDTDDFRPTTPGNSPGAGHKHAKEEEDFPPTDIDDFRPTTPGNSPGAGHKHAKEEEDFRPSDPDDFRPTTPGNSPGAGHKHAKEEEDFRPTAPANSPSVGHKHAKEEEVNSRVKGDDNTIVTAGNAIVSFPTTPSFPFGARPPPKHADDFSPTAPGYSPHVGHPIQN